MRNVLIVSLCLTWIAGAALAQTAPASPPSKAPGDAAPAAKRASPGEKKTPGDAAAKRPAGEKGDVADPFRSCLAIWEPATHMSRQEWARACRRVADRLKNIQVK
jgi:hypothetical protein